MNAFQRECRERIESVLKRHELSIGFAAQPASEPTPDGADTFLRGDLLHAGRHYKVFVYADGAGVNVQRNWYVLERQDYASPDALMDTFCAFLEGCLSGAHPVTALQQARE